ncbi:Guanine nucleotide-binding protein alpha-4 subunit [Termitomyces sp. J132]|nr:Guanine nucleotide-binding protein alpha-4 subunit [Termitomyces sp. J132]
MVPAARDRTQIVLRCDPLDDALRPPPDETSSERDVRVAREEEASRISQAIDASIKAEKQARKKQRIVRLLLLGQSESGKSTTLRQFQRLYTPTAFREERILWRAVIQLNIVRSIRIILDTIAAPPRRASDSDVDSDDDLVPHHAHARSRSHPSSLDALRTRLQPLRHIEALLIAKLVPPNEDEATHLVSPHQQFRNQEIFVRPGAAWKGALARARIGHHNQNSVGSAEEAIQSGPGRPTSAGTTGLETQDEPQKVLHQCRRDMVLLWNDDVVREILVRKKVRLEELPGFFLNDLERVTSLRYMPTDDDVLKARLKTVGVSEYKFEMEVTAGRDSGTEWRIVDVGGSRSQRPTWAPFFDDVDAIIFLAPISGFDQVLAEDKSINRLEDSVLLWKAVCSNKLLANVDLVLFLNKCDILDKKLRAGVKLSRYVKSYGDRGNDLDTVTKYLRGKFSAIHREYSPNPRKFYAFLTSVTDTATTAGIIASVRDMVIRQHLKQSKLL